jgi:PAS domain-containing protein
MDGKSPSDDVAFKVRTWLQNLESGKPHAVVCRFRGADSLYRWFEVRGEPLRASDGTVLSWSGVLIDIDDRREADEALRESESNLRQVIDTVPGLLWSIGPDGELTQINQGVLDYSGMRFEDHLGYYKFHHPDDLSDALNAFSHAMQTGTSYQALSRLRRASQSRSYCSVPSHPFGDFKDEPAPGRGSRCPRNA